MTRWGRIVAAIVLGMGLSGLAHAEDEAVNKAREYFQAGAQAYAVGEYAAAVQAFEQANALAPRPALLFSIAQAERRQYFLDKNRDHLVRAIRMYRAYLEADAQGSRKVDAVQALSELEPLVPPDSDGALREPTASALPTRVMVSSPAPEVRIALDGATPSPSPLVSEVTPGRHVAHLYAPGHFEIDREIIAVKNALVTLDVALLERPAQLAVVAPDGALLSIDGRVQGECPFPKPLELPAGLHLITFTKSGFVGVAREERLARGKATVLNVSMRRSKQRTASLITMGASLSAFAAGGVFAYFTLDRNRSAQSFLDAQGRAPLLPDALDQYQSARQDRDRFRTAALVSVGAGTALAATAILLFALDSPAPGKTTASAGRGVAAVVSPGLTGLGLRAAF
jgi:tetratricopeptide (TPR) repeat protein